MIRIHQSPLSFNILTLLRREQVIERKIEQEEGEYVHNVMDKYGDIITVPESPCRLPWPLMGKIFEYAVMPLILSSSQKCLLALMLLDRRSLAEVNRMLVINPVMKSEWIENQMRRCNDRIKIFSNRGNLSHGNVQRDLEIRLARLQHISIDFSRIKYNMIFKILYALSKKTNIKSFSIFADGSFCKRPDKLINAISLILKNNKELINIQYMSLCKNNLNANHIKKLAEALSGREIDLLALDENPIGEEGKAILVRCLQNRTVHTLQINATKWSGTDVANFAAM